MYPISKEHSCRSSRSVPLSWKHLVPLFVSAGRLTGTAGSRALSIRRDVVLMVTACQMCHAAEAVGKSQDSKSACSVRLFAIK